MLAGLIVLILNSKLFKELRAVNQPTIQNSNSIISRGIFLKEQKGHIYCYTQYSKLLKGSSALARVAQLVEHRPGHQKAADGFLVRAQA